MMTELDTQIGGTHYTDMKIQPLEYSMANNLNACEHSVLKYISRHKQKGGREDLLKARDMLDKLIEFEYPDPTKAEEPDEELCTDEGCIKYGTSHVCYEPEIMPAKVFR